MSQEEIFGLVDEDDESDEEIGEWTKRLKQVKFQAKLDKKKDVSGMHEFMSEFSHLLRKLFLFHYTCIILC